MYNTQLAFYVMFATSRATYQNVAKQTIIQAVSYKLYLLRCYWNIKFQLIDNCIINYCVNDNARKSSKQVSFNK